MDRNKKQHWWLLAFSVPVPGSWQPASLQVGTSTKLMTSQYMEAARDQNGLPPNAVLISASYLGYASAHKMQGTSDAMKMATTTEAFRQGMRAGLLSVTGAPVQNPYSAADMVDAAILEQDWQAGFVEAQQAHEETRVAASHPVE